MLGFVPTDIHASATDDLCRRIQNGYCYVRNELATGDLCADLLLKRHAELDTVLQRGIRTKFVHFQTQNSRINCRRHRTNYLIADSLGRKLVKVKQT